MADKRFIGLQYPIVKNSKGLLATSSGVDQIKADILQLLLTTPGERVMLPEYGTPLRTLFFEPNDPSLCDRARIMIAHSIEMWEPRIVITDIQVSSQINTNSLDINDTGDERDAILSVLIAFKDPMDITTVEELKLEIPIGGM